jgi:hypothetical protein
VWLFSGYNDGSVRRGAMSRHLLPHYVTNGNVFYQTNNRAPHALVTDDYGGPCLGDNAKYVSNCGYDAAGQLLQHIYGRLPARTPRTVPSWRLTNASSSLADPKSIGLADTGYVYVQIHANPQRHVACTSFFTVASNMRQG